MLEQIEDRIIRELNSIRHYLQEDGGDIEFVRFDEYSQIAFVRFTGNCATCPLRIMTLRGGIQRFLIQRIPEIWRVELERK